MTLHTRVSACLVILSALLPLASARADEHAAHGLSTVPVEPAAQLQVDGPLAGPLRKGLVVVPFRAEHLKILPVYGEAALGVAPRIGHLHITVDHAPWHYLQSSEEPIVIQGLPRGPHQLTLELADANHRVLAVKQLDFTIP